MIPILVFLFFLPFILGGIWFSCHSKPEQQKRTETNNYSLPLRSMLQRYSYTNPVSPTNLISMLDKPWNDGWDEWYLNFTEQFMHNGCCLDYINQHADLRYKFWHNIECRNLHPEKDLIFQQLLVSCYNDDKPKCNFEHLLHDFRAQFTFLPEIERLVYHNNQFYAAYKVICTEKSERVLLGIKNI